MAFDDFNNEYKYVYHTYPVYAQEYSTEGATKRFLSMPGPKEVFDYALMGLPKYMPLTGEHIRHDGLYSRDGIKTADITVADFLTSALSEIEMDMGCILSEETKFHSEDYIDGMFVSNFQGMRLQYWPVTEIHQVRYKFPHTNTPNDKLFRSYTIPSPWVYLRRNKVNIIASMGSIAVEPGSTTISEARGFLQYITGFTFGAYQPGCIEISYKCGFKSDKLPAVAADLIKTWAALRYLSDLSPALFPNSGVSVSVDGIQQSVSFNIQQMIATRVEKLEAKKLELKRSFKKQFGRTIDYSFIGA